MTRQELRQRLTEEVHNYMGSLSYSRALALVNPIVEQRGPLPPDSVDSYQVSVRLLETVTTERENYAHVVVSVDDGKGWGVGPFQVVTPEVASIFFHSDGRIETAF